MIRNGINSFVRGLIQTYLECKQINQTYPSRDQNFIQVAVLKRPTSKQ